MDALQDAVTWLRNRKRSKRYVPLILQPLNVFRLVDRLFRSHGLVYVP